MSRTILSATFAFLLSAGSGIVSAQAAPAAPGGLVGTVISQPVAAVDFSLVDQKGATFRMSATRGKIVVLSFIYTHCADICPFIMMKIKEAQNLLGADMDKVAFVAITTDPKRDTPAVNASYSKEAGLYDTWHFLTGSVGEVKKVWAEYGVGVHEVSDGDVQDTAGGSVPDMQVDRAKGLDGAEIAVVHSLIKKFAGGYEVTHSAPFWIVDADGRIRAILDAEALPSDIVTDIKALQ